MPIRSRQEAVKRRLPQELRSRGITTVEEANKFPKRTYIKELNRRFTTPAADPDATAFVPCGRSDLDLVFSIQTTRTVNKDNTVSFKNMTLHRQAIVARLNGRLPGDRASAPRRDD
jgi:hypothetical protein